LKSSIQKTEADKWLDEQALQYDNDKMVKWARSVFEGNTVEGGDTDNSEVRLLQYLIQLKL
jgi:hypothetical protein